MKQIAQWLEQRDNLPSVVLLVYPGASSMVQAPFFRRWRFRPNQIGFLPGYRSRRRTRKRLVSFEVKALTEMGGVVLGIRGW